MLGSYFASLALGFFLIDPIRVAIWLLLSPPVLRILTGKCGRAEKEPLTPPISHSGSVFNMNI